MSGKECTVRTILTSAAHLDRGHLPHHILQTAELQATRAWDWNVTRKLPWFSFVVPHYSSSPSLPPKGVEWGRFSDLLNSYSCPKSDTTENTLGNHGKFSMENHGKLEDLAASPESLLEMENFRLHPRSTESESAFSLHSRLLPLHSKV